MNTFLIAAAFIIIGCLGLSTAANAQTRTSTLNSVQSPVQKNAQTSDATKNKVTSDDYYFQSWNCLTDL